MGELDSAAAFRRLLDDLRAAADVVDAPASGQRLDRVEGHRHLLRLLSAGVDLFVERADPARPATTVWMTPTRKFLGDNPDTIYTTFPVSGDRTYRLRLSGGNADYRGIVVYGRGAGRSVTIVAAAHDTDLVAEPDGSLLVTLSAAPGPGNHVLLDDSAFWVMVREYVTDPVKVPAAVTVTADPSLPTRPVDDAQLATRLDELGRWVRDQARADDYLAGLQLRAGDRPVEPPPRDLVSQFLPSPDIHYQGTAWRLGPDEALVVRGRAPRARYWSFTVMNHWMESVDADVPVSLNHRQVRVGDDGTFVVTLTRRALPDGRDQLVVGDREAGLLAFRTLLAETPPEPLTYQLVTR